MTFSTFAWSTCACASEKERRQKIDTIPILTNKVFKRLALAEIPMTKTVKSERSPQSLPTPAPFPFHSQAFSAQSKSVIIMKPLTYTMY